MAYSVVSCPTAPTIRMKKLRGVSVGDSLIKA